MDWRIVADEMLQLDAMNEVVSVNPQILGGTPCFTGTRVPLRSLFDHLRLGYTIEGFIEQFPTVKREQVEMLLERSRRFVCEETSPISVP